MDNEKIARINELAKEAKNRELTEEEMAERAVLRKEYIASFKANIRGNLDNILVETDDGNYEPLKRYSGDKVKNHHHHGHGCSCGCGGNHDNKTKH